MERRWGEDVEDVLHSDEVESFAAENLKILREAVGVGEECLALLQDKASEVRRLMTMHWLALSFFYSGRYSDGMRMGHDCMLLERAHLDKKDTFSLKTMHSVALMLKHAEFLNEASSIAQCCCDMRVQVLGQEHKDTLETLNLLGDLIQLYPGNMAEAIGTSRKILAVDRKVLAVDHKVLGEAARVDAAGDVHARKPFILSL